MDIGILCDYLFYLLRVFEMVKYENTKIRLNFYYIINYIFIFIGF